jgi:hypothetical protein
MSLLFKNYSKTHLKSVDFGVAEISLVNPRGNLKDALLEYVKYIYDQHVSLINGVHSSIKYDWGQPADFTGKPDYKPYDPYVWIPLVLPVGNNTFIDVNYPATYKVQELFGKNYEHTIPSLDLSEIEMRIQKLKGSLPFLFEQKVDDVYRIYEATFFSKSNPLFYIFRLCTDLNIKFMVPIDNQINYYYALSNVTYNTACTLFTLKNKYNIPRPITINRNIYKNSSVNIWYNNSGNSTGNFWLPINDFNLVCPAYPDCPNENSTFVTALGYVLKKIYLSQNLYDSVTQTNSPSNGIDKLLGKHSISTEQFPYLSVLTNTSVEYDIIVRDIDDLVDKYKMADSILGISYSESCEIGYELGKLIGTTMVG